MSQDYDQDGKFEEDEFAIEDVERESAARLMVEKGEPLPVKRIIVNHWRTVLHGAKVGIKKGAQWKSKSRQFTAEMQIKGDITIKFDEDKICEDAILDKWEKQRENELKSEDPSFDLIEVKKNEEKYERLIIKPLEKMSLSDKQDLAKKWGVTIPPIPPKDDSKLVLALNTRYWDLDVADKTMMEDIDGDGKIQKKEFRENYLKREFGKFANMNRRLIVKVFRGLGCSDSNKAGLWMGTVEQSLYDSMLLTFGEKDPLYSGVISLPGFDYQTRLIRSHAITDKRIVLPIVRQEPDLEELLRMSILKKEDVDPTKKKVTNYYVHYYLIEGKRFSPGSDYIVRDPQNKMKKIASIDNRAVDIGGRWDITFFDRELSKDPLFRQTLVLFASMIKFHPDAQRTMRKLYKELKRTIKEPSEDEVEALLYSYLENILGTREFIQEYGDTITETKKKELVEFAKHQLRTANIFENVSLSELLETKYNMNITAHELTMLFNPRRVRS